MEDTGYTILLERYLSYAEASVGPVHYTSKENLPFIKRHGLLSPYALYETDNKKFQKDLLDRRKDIENAKQLFDLFRKGGYTEKSIFFAFRPITLGLHRERDKFVKGALMLRLPKDKLQTRWDYRLIQGRDIKRITLREVLVWCDTDFTKYEKKSGGRWLFSNIPHLAIDTPSGSISMDDLYIGPQT